MNYRFTCTIVLFLAFLTVLACEQSLHLAGQYEAIIPFDQDSVVTLILKADGKGSWNMAEAVPFQWEARGGKVWLHTKSGGLIVGMLTETRTIEINLPGVGVLMFKKRE